MDALGNQQRWEIRDLARAHKDVQSPLPRILTMTREVREGVTGIQKSQANRSEALDRLERTSELVAITPDYLVALAEDADDVEEDDDFTDEQDSADTALEVADEERDGAEDDARGSTTDAANSGPDDWHAGFERVEEAWLAGRPAATPRGTRFSPFLSDLRLEDHEPKDTHRGGDRFRVRAGGDRFSYCPLHGAVDLVRMRKPSLDNALVVVRYRELARLPPCTGLEACPGLSELLSGTRA